MTIRNYLSSALLLSAITFGHAFVAPRPALFKQSSRLFDSEEMPEPEQALIEQVHQNKMLGLDEEYVAFPCTDYSAPEVVELCMNAMQDNNLPYGNAGLEVCFNFSSDRCRAAQGGSLESFIQFAHNPVFGSMVDSEDWTVVSTGPVIAGTPTRGAMQTVLVNVSPSKGNSRQFLWTLQQERRPPRAGCWLVYECIDTDQTFQQTL